MQNAARQANFQIPENILADLRSQVDRRQQSKFVAEALRKELQRLRLRNALETSFGAWNDRDHPELQGGTEEFIRNIRKSTRREDSP
jgi:hypothetical protein